LAEKKESKKEKPISKPKEDIRGIIRIAEVDVRGHKKIPVALLKVKGIGQTLARAVPMVANIDSNLKIGALSDEQIKKLEDVIKDPLKYNIPLHMINRRSDPFTGEDKHITSSDLVFTKKMDIDLQRKIQSYKGIRHQFGLPVRGQRTRSSFRKGKTMGVAKKKSQRSAAKKK